MTIAPDDAVPEAPASLIAELRTDHVSIAVPDLEEAITWYGSVFGLALERRHRIDAEDLHGEVAFVARDGIRLELWSVRDVAPVPDERRVPNEDLRTCGTKHIGFGVRSLQGVLDELVRRDVEIASVQRRQGVPHRYEAHPESSADPSREPAFAVFLRDPAGTLIELLDPDRR